MYKILIILIVLFFGFSIITAQIKDENSKQDTSLKQTTYSESLPYEPHRFRQKDKKPKKDSNSKKSEPSDDAIPETAVKIPVFVLDGKENPVNYLQKADFKVFADNAEQEIVAFETAKTGRNILLVVDTSPSIAYKDDDLRKFVGEMTKALQPGDKIQIVKFNEVPEILSEPTNDPLVLQKALKKIKIGDGTSIYDSMQIIYRKYLKTVAEKPVIILVTDGVDTTSQRTDYISSLVLAEESGAVVFPFYFDSYESFQKNQLPILLGSPFPRPQSGIDREEYEIGRAYLKDIAALSGGKTYNIEKFADIKKEDFEAVFKFINPQYYLSIKRAENTGAFERKQIKVRVNRPNLSVQARGSYVTGKD